MLYYFSEMSLKSSFNALKGNVENKFLGILGILKCINSDFASPNITYQITDGELACWLDNTCYLKNYEGNYGSSNLYVKLSNNWSEYVGSGFFKKTVNIFNLIIFVYKFKSFQYKPSNFELVEMFCKDYHLSQDIVQRWFDCSNIEIFFSETATSKSECKVLFDIANDTISFSSPFSVAARAGELTRAPFVQTLYAGMDSIKCLLILRDNIDEYYNSKKSSQCMINKIEIDTKYRPYITAIKLKPFLLLAGISGTGKSRIVRELARACWEEDSDEYKVQKPKNFEMVQVKPNWHDSSELIGYVSRVSGKAEFVAGDFLKFVAKAWEDQDTPYFLCLDEMNLAPVEQYFAEYLSVVESRKCGEDGVVTTDPILKKEDAEWYFNLTAAITSDDKVRTRFNEDGISIPQNLIVVGTVNMDETTFSFSRKVLDRAMTIEMNEVDLHGGLTKRHESIGKLGNAELVGSAVEGVDVYDDYTDVCDTALGYLQKVNDVLEGTPFKIAYRTRNEFLLYVVNNLPYNKDKDGNDLPQGYVIARALDEITSMKILSRIEGDDTKVKDSLLDALSQTITEGLNTLTDEDHLVKSVSVAKLEEMKNRLQSGYTSFWS